MACTLQPAGRPLLVGSQPLRDHAEATRLVLRYCPDAPNWVQLPVYAAEGMVAQFVEGFPGLARQGDRLCVDTAGDRFEEELVLFFEEYMEIGELKRSLEDSRFALSPQATPGFFALLSALGQKRPELFALKGQITGPVTLCVGLTDQNRRALFYDDTLRDAAVKMLALKAAWQVRRLSAEGVPVIVSIDEPALAGYGSSELISISREDIVGCLQEIIGSIHAQGGLAGVHVCANTDWSMLLSAQVDIVNFDAYGYFDKFILYADQIRAFLNAGGCLAWGLVPTAHPDQVEAVTLEGLWEHWQSCLEQLAALGMPAHSVQRQSFITPSCGTGSLSPELSLKVLELTRALSSKVRGIQA